MTAELFISLRELTSRFTNDMQVRLLWSERDGRMWVAVARTRAGDAFLLEVRDGESPLDVFHHPYAYAAYHGVDTRATVAEAGAVDRAHPVVRAAAAQ